MVEPGGEEATSNEREMIDLFERCVDVAASTLEEITAVSGVSGLRARGHRPGQYSFDLAVDRAVLAVLGDAGVGVLSEESGLTEPDADVVVVVDPVDGSTNASRGIPWYACSLCALDAHGPWVAMVANLATGTRYRAVRGRGATRDQVAIGVAREVGLEDALVVLNGHPPAHFGWRQYRALGATALDVCAVADGSVDASIDCTRDALGPWDYMGAKLVLEQAGGVIVDLHGRDLVTRDPGARRTPVGASGSRLLEQALIARGTG